MAVDRSRRRRLATAVALGLGLAAALPGLGAPPVTAAPAQPTPSRATPQTSTVPSSRPAPSTRATPSTRSTRPTLPVPSTLLPGLPPLPEAPTEPLPDPQVPAPEARRMADEILAAPEYQEPPKSFVERSVDWLAERLDQAEPRPRRPPPGPDVPAGGDASVLAWIVVALLIGLVVFLALRWHPQRRRKRKQDDPLELSESEMQRVADEWIAEAERLEREEQWKAALRCRYRALIGELIERGVVRDLPGRTSGELRADVRRRSPELTGAFAEASYLFDDAWYGDLPTGRPESDAFRQLAARVLDHRPAESGAS